MHEGPLEFDAQVSETHRIDIEVPFPSGQRVRVLVLPADDEFSDLMQASESSLDFWDNPLDDEDWNNA